MFNRSFRHWTARYIIDRLQLLVYEGMYPDSPWFCRDAARILDSWLKPTDKGMEWGSGRSTVWFAKRVSHLISVEHDPKWATIVKKKLHDGGLADRVDYNLLPDGKGERSDCKYVKAVRDITPNSLDFCLVDGVSRDHCALACLEKLKPGAILVVDDIERYLPRSNKSHSPNSRGLEDGFASEAWEQFAKITRNWRCVWTTNGVSDTALWIKEHRKT